MASRIVDFDFLQTFLALLGVSRFIVAGASLVLVNVPYHSIKAGSVFLQNACQNRLLFSLNRLILIFFPRFFVKRCLAIKRSLPLRPFNAS